MISEIFDRVFFAYILGGFSLALGLLVGGGFKSFVISFSIYFTFSVIVKVKDKWEVK